jgi:hypothetical protein
MPRKPTLAILALLAVGLAGCAGRPVGEKGALGDWVVRSHDDPANGRFSHCALSAKIGRQVNLYLSMSALKALHIGFERSSWRWTPGTRVPVRLGIDDQPVESLAAEAAKPDFLWVYWADWTKPSMHQQDLRVGRTLALDAAGEHFVFDLTGLRPGVRALAACAEAGRARAAPRRG